MRRRKRGEGREVKDFRRRNSLSASSASKSVSVSASFLIMSRALRTSFFLMVFRAACCCRFSLETCRGSVSESTMPCTKLRYLQQQILCH